ncbi:hypothetical protein BC834DRAFT_590700 [Gloeopeniophorella convolvens]|nr:hypothetical protein BC834DRAFT_590700 [Gloeopeniophorella convolvens]
MIDLTSDTPPPEPVSRLDPVTSVPALPRSSPATSPSPQDTVPSEGGTRSSSMLDLTETQYRDFEVSLDSSLCLPSARPKTLKRLPTPVPSRAKQKTVTFAPFVEEVVKADSGNQEAHEGAVAFNIKGEPEELEYLEFAPEAAQGQLGNDDPDPRPIRPTNSRTPVRKTEALSPLAPSLACRQEHSYVAEVSPPPIFAPKRVLRPKDAPRPSSSKSKARRQGDYIDAIMTV